MTIPNFFEKKAKKEKIVSITAYDYFTALVAKSSNVDFILVGDSLGNTIQGNTTTIPVTLDEVIYHGKIVKRAAPESFIIVDMPLGTTGVTIDSTVSNCIKAFKECQCQAIKIEGTSEIILNSISILVGLGVPIMAHIGLLPQRIHVKGGYKIEGKTDKSRDELIEQAKALYNAGAFSTIIECVKADVAKEITEKTNIITIGIGAGKYTDGQVIVFHDLLGMGEYIPKKFVRQYANLYEIAKNAVVQYKVDVIEQTYPSENESF